MTRHPGKQHRTISVSYALAAAVIWAMVAFALSPLGQAPPQRLAQAQTCERVARQSVLPERR